MDHLQPVSRFINPYSQKQRHKFKPCIAVIVKKHERPADALVRVLRVKFHPCKENSQRLVLYVTDGELVIQCLVNGQKHPLFTSGDITKNDYIRLIEFDISSRKQVGTGNRICILELRELDRVPKSNVDFVGKPPPATPPSSQQEISRLVKIQEDLKKEREELREQERRRKSEKESGAIVPSSYQDQVPKAREDSEPSKPSSISTIGKPKRMELQPTNIKPVVPNPPRLVSHPSEQLECQATFQPPKSHPVSTTQQLTTPSKRLREDDRAGESPDAFERAVKRPKIATGVTGLRQDTAEGARLRQTLARIQSRPAIQSTISITPLTEVRSPYTQWSAGQTNRPVPRVLDVLAYVTSISPPQQRPIGLKRDFTIRDSSLREDESDVALSVWDEPHGFCPQVGSLVLLRNLKTHHFRGGSLNAYGNECGKKAWAFCGTTAIEKLGLEVGEITEWWSPRETAPPGGSKRPMAGLVPVSTPMDRPVGSDSIFSAADFDEADLHSHKTQDARVAGLSEGQAEPSLQDVPPHDSFGWNDQDFDLKNPPTPEVFAGNPFELPPSSQAVPPEYDDDDFDGI